MALAAVLRVYRSFERTTGNEQRAQKELDAMCSAVEHLRSVGIKSIFFSVLTGDHPDADKWDTASALRKLLKQYRGVRVVETTGDPFVSALNQVLFGPIKKLGFTHMLSVSYTSIHLLTPKVMLWIRDAIKHHALSIAIVPPDMTTGMQGAANNQCMVWDVAALIRIGGFDSRDAKPYSFDMNKDIEGVGEIIPALKMGPQSMAVILPDVELGDTRITPDQEKKRANKERRIDAWLAREGKDWNDLDSLIKAGFDRIILRTNK